MHFTLLQVPVSPSISSQSSEIKVPFSEKKHPSRALVVQND